MIENENYEYLIGKYITNYKETKQYIDFITNDNYVIRIDIEEGTTFDKDYTEIKIESIRIPEFTIMRIKR